MELKKVDYEWFSFCPEGWKIVRIGNALSEINEKNNPVRVTNILSLTNTKGVIPYEEKGNQGNKAKDDLSGYKIAYKNTIIANSMNILIGSVGLSAYEGCVSPVYYVFEAKEGYDIRFLNYIFMTKPFQKVLRKYANGILEIRLRVSASDILKRKMAVPNITKQSDIADYLDTKCSVIDELIEEARKSIEEYKKLKVLIISETVTQGINYSGEFKKIGVEWLEKIPNNWKVSKIKYCTVFGPKYDESKLGKDSEVTFTPMDRIKNGYYIDNSVKFGEIQGSYTQYGEGDIVLAKVTPCFENSNVAIMDNLHGGIGYGSSELFVLKPVSVNSKFLMYYLQYDGFKQAACSTMTGTGGLKRVSSSFVQNSIIPLPSKIEQEDIALYLDEKVSNINDMIQEKEAMIEDLISLKNTLIYDCVTGKKEV